MSAHVSFRPTAGQRRVRARAPHRDAARDPRTIAPFPHGRVAAAVAAALLAVVLLSAFRPAPAMPPAELATATAAAHGPCFGDLDMFERVAASATDRWQICFQRGGMARLRVVGDGRTKLDCVVTAPGGGVVARSEDGGDLCVLEWRARESGEFRLEIRNRGALPNAYRLISR